MDKLLVGIDFGTSTNFVTKYDFQKKRAVEIANMGGYGESNIFGNTIYIESDGNVILGETADKKSIGDAMNYFSDIKRYISSDNWKHKIPHLDYEMHSAQDIASLILKEIKVKVEKSENKAIAGVVLTVPYSYSETYRHRLREAAVDAGLNVIKIIEEPIAAAVTFGLLNEHSEIDEKVLVFDFGGGTLDITIFEFTKHNQSKIKIEVLNTDGVEKLGGKDIDNILMTKFKEYLNVQFEDIGNEVELKDFQNLMVKVASETKENLSQDDKYDIYENYKVNNVDKELELVLEREQFETWLKVNNIVGQIEDALDRSLDDIGEDGIDPEDIDKIILVGGSSNIPLIHNILEEYFDKAPLKQDEPGKLVGYGAAIIAGLTEDSSIDYELIRKVSKDVGLAKGNKFETILRKNMMYGVESDMFLIENSNQVEDDSTIKLSFYEGDSPIVEDCEKIGVLELEKSSSLFGLTLSKNEDDGRLIYHVYDEKKTLIETDYIEKTKG